MKRRLLPGQRASSRGRSNFRFGKARTTLKGGGGSGEPTTREVVQGVRTGLAGSATAGPGLVPSPAARVTVRADARKDRRRPPGEGDGMSPTPEQAAACV